MRPRFTGDESPTDILSAVLADFSMEAVTIVYENEIPYLKIHHDDPTHYVCSYRLDTLLLPQFTEAERLCEYHAHVDALGTREHASLMRAVAYAAMSSLLNVLVVNHPIMLLDTLDEAQFLIEGKLLHATTAARIKAATTTATPRTLSISVRQVLDKLIEKIAKRKRESLADLLNRFPLVTVPTGVGRPLGSTKSEEKKAKDKAEFEFTIEQTVKTLFHSLGREPFKYEVAEALGIGGINPQRYRLTD